MTFPDLTYRNNDGEWETFDYSTRERRPATPEEIAPRLAEEKADEDARRLHDQISAAEVPGFAVRTVVDDTIGKLYAVREQLRTPIPEGVDALLDDIEAMVEKLVEVAHDPDAEPMGPDGPKMPEPLITATGCRWSDTYRASASDTIGSCSCGAVTL